jgi:hypothetical protein
LSSAESATNPRVPHPPGFPVKLVWGQRTSCGFPYRKPHTLPWLGPCSRKSGVLRAFCEGWNTTNLDTDRRVSHPLQRAQRMGHPPIRDVSAVPNTNRRLIEDLFLIRKPHEARGTHRIQQEIRGSAVEGPAVSLLRPTKPHSLSRLCRQRRESLLDVTSGRPLRSRPRAGRLPRSRGVRGRSGWCGRSP